MDNVKKKRMKIIAVVVVLIAAISAGIIAISANISYIEGEILYYCMPDSIELSIDDETEITVYKRKNKDFDRKDDNANILSAYEFYCYDENGEEIAAKGDEKLVYDGISKGMPYLSFAFQAMEKVTVIKKTAAKIIAVIIIVIVIAVIAFWFKKWSEKQDAEKEKKFGVTYSRHLR